MNSVVQLMNKLLFFARRNQLHNTQNVSGIGKPFARIFSGSLIPNTSLMLSVCLHLIGASIIGLSSIKTTDIHPTAMQIDILSNPSPKRVLTRPAKEKSISKLVHPKHVNLHRPTHQIIYTSTVVLKTEIPQMPAVTFPAPIDGILALDDSQSTISGMQCPFYAAVEKKCVYVSSVNLLLQRTKRISDISSLTSDQVQLTPVPLDIPTFTKPTQNATFLKKVDPIYPESARLSHQQGLVVLEATIGVDGKARKIKVVEVIEISGLGCEEAAIQALKSSLFSPATQGKIFVSQRLRIPYRFSLKG